MHKIIQTLAGCISLFFLCNAMGCQKAEPILGGERELRKMNEYVGSTSKTSSAFFLIVGYSSSESSYGTSVKFAWKMNDGIYAFSSLPLEKIRVQIDPKAIRPTLRFVFPADAILDRDKMQDWIDCNVQYAIIKTTAEHWPIEINLPMNQK